MAYKCTFMDNDVYSADDVNNVFSKLTSGGAVLFSDTGSTLSDLNTGVSNFVSSGVTLNPDSCKVTAIDGGYKISEGSCFMPDGSMIEFTGGGEPITIPAGTAQYVYLKRNKPDNTIDIVVSETAPDANCIKLAAVSETGEVSDVRQFSACKIAGSGKNISVSMDINKEFQGKERITVDTGFAGFDCVICTWHGKEGFGRRCTDISDGEFHKIQNPSGYETLRIKKDGSRLIMENSGENLTAYNVNIEVR